MRLDVKRAEAPLVYRTRALGTVAELEVTEATALVAAAELLERELERIDRVASRFRKDSELTALNRSAGSEVSVGPGLMEAVQVALAIAELTHGLVDPTVGEVMEHLGYDRDFDDVRPGLAGELPGAGPVPGWRSVAVDRVRHSVTLAAGTTLDLGATAKALAADRAAHFVHDRLGCGVLVSLGGDVAVAGPAPDAGFAVGVADRCASADPSEVIALRSGGLASSGTGVRRWRLGHREVHHIVDPRTGLPAETCWRTVTVAASTCVQANAASTAAVVLGPSARAWLEELHLPARLVRLDGSVVRTSPWPETAEDSRPGTWS